MCKPESDSAPFGYSNPATPFLIQTTGQVFQAEHEFKSDYISSLPCVFVT